jgi:hypothetical protein
MSQQSPSEARQEAEQEIFELRKKADLYLQAGDTEEFNRIQTTISELQREHAVFSGVKRKNDERTA